MPCLLMNGMSQVRAGQSRFPYTRLYGISQGPCPLLEPGCGSPGRRAAHDRLEPPPKTERSDCTSPISRVPFLLMPTPICRAVTSLCQTKCCRPLAGPKQTNLNHPLETAARRSSSWPISMRRASPTSRDNIICYKRVYHRGPDTASLKMLHSSYIKYESEHDSNADGATNTKATR